jgi:hypothetical protein
MRYVTPMPLVLSCEPRSSRICITCFHHHQILWSKPSYGWENQIEFRCSGESKEKFDGGGYIAQDYLGIVLASMCYVDKYISDPTIAEAIGARLGAE